MNLVKVFSISFKANHSLFNESITHILADDSVLLLIAEINKQVISYCLGFIHFTFYANGKVSWLEEIMVDEKNTIYIIKDLLLTFRRFFIFAFI